MNLSYWLKVCGACYVVVGLILAISAEREDSYRSDYRFGLGGFLWEWLSCPLIYIGTGILFLLRGLFSLRFIGEDERGES